MPSNFAHMQMALSRDVDFGLVIFSQQCLSPIIPSSHSQKAVEDEKLVVNISGRRFETWQNTLEKYPDTLLGSNERVSGYFLSFFCNVLKRGPDMFTTSFWDHVSPIISFPLIFTEGGGGQEAGGEHIRPSLRDMAEHTGEIPRHAAL